jgi:uncharacterized protein YprB with RNaseH-like and TPR domain/predicted nuclease with RNAse H fold/dephospho-CoA kinase
MLTHTFLHIKGIGAKKERELWRNGITSWEDLESKLTSQLGMFNRPNEPSVVGDSRDALREGDANFFARNLPRHEHYRIALGFPSQTLFLDIETTGLSRYYDTITLVGWSIDSKYSVYIKGGDDRALRAALIEAKAIVTFNGSLFDLPFVRQEFPGLSIPLAHIDLRFLARRVGLSGGQKVIEKEIGLERPKHLKDIVGEAAPLLWYKYRQGDLDSLKLLISYNHADIEGMKYIFDIVTTRLIEQQHLPLSASSLYRFSEHPSRLRWPTTNSTKSDEVIHIKHFHGRVGPLISLKDLGLGATPLRVVGIDLTGSEARPTGWCLLDDEKAYTRRIETDEDIVRSTMEVRPKLISIDSPLSLPKGRLSVGDDDPGRRTFGITRYCERLLKKRGVNVYPSLIQSMQNLTARGIRLAERFRKLGVPVIESYPGAAQDIINIPRKRADLGLLKKGLNEFGIIGEFITTHVSHDELDAITSAIVGLFFMSGKFEALGNEDEEYLIVPEISSDNDTWGGRVVVGLSGAISCGKTTAGRALELEGFKYGRYSLVLKDMLQQRGIPVSRDSLQQIGEEVYNKHGQRWLGRELIKRLPSGGDIVIDGLRHPEDHALLIETFGPDFLHIHINAPMDIRLARYLADGGTEEEFEAAIKHPVESNVPKVAPLAHITISNVGSKEAFEAEVLQFVESLRVKKEGRILCQ